MTVDFDRRLQGGGQLQHNRNHQQQSQYQQRPIPPTSSPSKLDNNYMATSATRVPLQPRLGGVTSSSGDAYLNRLSTLESSNNDNNKARLDSYSNANSSSNHLHGRFSEKDSSTLAQVNAPSASDSNHKKPVRSDSVGRFSPRGRSSSLQRSSQPRSTSVSAAARDTDLENVVIEEKRRRANGDGYTLHRYLRGRLLGRGGFAKVYLCTALDTNKNYAVKIVPKTNLVKQRARQKVRHVFVACIVFVCCVKQNFKTHPTFLLIHHTSRLSQQQKASSRNQDPPNPQTQAHLRIQAFL